MKRPLALALLALGLAASAFAAEALQTAGQAAAKYQSRDYNGAAALYEKIVAAGQCSPALYYDLGNAYFKAGRPAQALLNYRRAERLAPRDADLRWNIDIVRSTLSDRIEDRSGNVFLVKWAQWRQLYSMDEAAMALTVCSLLLALAALLPLGIRSARPAAALLFAVAAAGLLVSGAAFYSKAHETGAAHVVVMPKEAAVRYGPSDSETKAFVLHEGAEARVADETAQWYFIELADGKSGWIPKSACERV